MNVVPKLGELVRVCQDKNETCMGAHKEPENKTAMLVTKNMLFIIQNSCLLDSGPCYAALLGKLLAENILK